MAGVPLPLDRPALHVDVEPGGEVILRGSLSSSHDGSVVDAATTTWPEGSPGGASVDAGGLVDFEAGGFHLTSRDALRHEVHAVATGKEAPACAAAGVAAPCLPLRTAPQAHSRLLAVNDWASSLHGGLTYEIVGAPVYAPATTAAERNAPVLGGLLAAAVAAMGIAFVIRSRKRYAASPRGQLQALAQRVKEKLAGADAVLAAALAPALTTAARAIERRRVDPATAEGERVREVLQRVELRIDQASAQAAADEQRRVTDELVLEMESAIEAADELSASQRSGAAPGRRA